MLSRLAARSRLLFEALLVIVALFLLHSFQTRNLLDSDLGQAPALQLVTLNGENKDLYKGPEVPTLVYFFAPWCGVCGASAHNIKALRESRNEQQLSILLVALDWQSIDEVRQFAERHALAMPVLLGDRSTAGDWQVFAFPSYYMLDSQRRIAHRDIGYSSYFGLWWRSRFTD